MIEISHLLPTEKYSGPLNPLFLYADKYRHWAFEKESTECAIAAVSEADRHRLVEAAKSPTWKNKQDLQSKIEFFCVSKESAEPVPLAAIASGPFSELGANLRREHQQIKTELAAIKRDIDAPGTCTVIEYREWAEEYRIRTRVNGELAMAPPVNSGERESWLLSDRGARKIAESCEYMARQHGGFKTFATGTFDDATRERIASGETTIQREVTRTMDALVKIYQRGWEYQSDGRTVKVPGHTVGKDVDKLRYCWVVEIPKNDAGEDNPHIHLLMDWRVDFEHFKAWSKRIESVWGNGYFHLEKIDDPAAAGAYMAKAAGYITKAAGQSDQGRVVGNRYAISKAARAPGWMTIAVTELGIMGRLIRETYDHIQHKHSRLFWQRKKLNEQRQSVLERAKAAQAAHPQKQYPIKAKTLRERIGARLMAVRSKINALPIRASKYHLVIKDKLTFYKYLQRAEAAGWGAEAPPCTRWIYLQKRLRQAWTDLELASYMRQFSEWADSARAGFAEYETLQLQPIAIEG